MKMRKAMEDAKELYVMRHGYAFPNQGISELIEFSKSFREMNIKWGSENW